MVTACLLGACSTRKPVYIAPDIAQIRMPVIRIAPIVDVREHPLQDVQVIIRVRNAVEVALGEKGYLVAPVSFSREDQRVSAGDLAAMDDADLARLAPPDTSHLMVVSLDRLENDVDELGRTSRIKLSGRLIDVAREKAIWRDTTQGDSDLGGLLSVLSGSSPTLEASYDAARSLFATLPDGERRKQSPGRATAAPGEQAPIPAGSLRPTQER
jgi:hypothetical protein